MDIRHFVKMQGLGNDYIFMNGLEREIPQPEALAVRLSDRHFGVGSDGLVLILPSQTADFRMRMFNADGSEGLMCGNAARCVGKYVYERGLTDKTVLTLETASGIRVLRLTTAAGTERRVLSVTVDMGRACFEAARVPVKDVMPEQERINVPLSAAGREWTVSCVSMGNPHCVVFCPDHDRLDLTLVGAAFENHPWFPQRINAEFVRQTGRSELDVRVWERGSGVTLACGTGACAVAAVAVRTGRCPVDEPLTVRLPGGALTVTVDRQYEITMTGPAETVFEGQFVL